MSDWPSNFEPGAPIPDDYVDPELSSLRGDSLASQTLLLLLVGGLAAFLATQYVAELRYWFTPHEALDLNEGAEESIWIGPAYRRTDGALEIPSNRHVRVEGIPERRTTSGDRQFVSLVGSQLYIEQRIDAEGPRLLRGQHRSTDHNLESARFLYEGAGRVIAFEDLPKRYEHFIRFYSDAYRIEFCGFEPSENLRSFKSRQRREIAEIIRETEGREASEEEISARMGSLARCQQAYLMIEDEEPQAFWLYPLLYGVFALVMAGSLFFLVRGIRRQLSRS